MKSECLTAGVEKARFVDHEPAKEKKHNQEEKTNKYGKANS